MIGSQERNCLCKMIKRGISLCLAVLTVVVMIPFAAFDVAAAKSGNFTYAINDDGTAIITHYNGSAAELTIPEEVDGHKVTSIGDSAFYGCSSLKSITIPDSVTTIGWSAFSGTAYYNNEDNWENGALYIGNHLIECKNTYYGEYTVKEGTKTIAEYAFYDFSSLTSITIPGSVTSIGRGAFFYCSSLKSITIPDSVTLLGDDAFYCCTSLTSITISEGITSIGNNAFYGCSSLTTINVASGNTCYSSEDGVLYNYGKTELILYPRCKSETEFAIPDSVTSIGNEAFSNCSSLTSITMPDGVTSIGDGAFSYCSSLKSIMIPWGVTSIGDSAFYGCSFLKSIMIPGSVTSIGGWAFSGCSSLTAINVASENTCYSSDDGVLYNYGKTELILYPRCKSETEFAIPDSVTSIGNEAFSNCSSLTSITMPDGVTSIGDEAFNKCSSLTSITIPNSVASIGRYAFYGCSSLTSITIPESVTSIGYRAFAFCTSLTSITIPNSVTSIEDSVFSDCYYLTNVILPDGLTSIGDMAFAFCTSLTSITIPEGVTSIGDRAFSDCSHLTSITIPDSVTSIGNNAFEYTSLEKVYYMGSEGEWWTIKTGNNDFNGAEIIFNHNHSKTVIKNAVVATCVSKGYSGDTYCADCDVLLESGTEVVAPGHDFSVFVKTEAPTCTEAGYTVYKCANCELTEERNPTAKIGHNYTTTVVAPTPAGQGYTFHTCLNCKDSYKDNYTNYVFDENAPCITVDSKNAKAGQSVTLDVVLENNPGMWGMDLVVEYDKTQLTLTGVTNGTVFADSEWVKGNLSGEKYILSYEANEIENNTNNGVVATLEFMVNEGATVDSLAAVTVSYKMGDIINIAFDDIGVAVVSGGVNIVDFIYGDLNSDGVVNKKDSLLLKMYLAGNTTDIDTDAADVFTDGSVNKKDSLLLKRYLAGNDVVLGS